MPTTILARIEDNKKTYSQVNWFSLEELVQAENDGYIVTKLSDEKSELAN